MPELSREQLVMAVITGRGPAYLRGLNLSSIDLSGAGWLVEADLRNADLSSANLRNAVLKGANLDRANLQSANMIGVALEGANLFKVKANVANLSKANLRGADLREANLVGACLARADLEEADLEGADLEGANLQGCNLRKARITKVNLKMADLEGADFTEAVADGFPLFQDGTRESKGFQGTIAGIKLTDLIQLGCLSRAALYIRVLSLSGEGNIYIGSGRVLHATAGQIQGERAFRQILGWPEGRFISHPHPQGQPVPTTIDKPVEHLLIESLRVMDEKRLQAKYSGLVGKLKKCVPMEASASDELLALLQKDGKELHRSDTVEITDVFHDDGEEIMCSISAGGEALIAPLKFLNLNMDHPLYTELAQIS